MLLKYAEVKRHSATGSSWDSNPVINAVLGNDMKALTEALASPDNRVKCNAQNSKALRTAMANRQFEMVFMIFDCLQELGYDATFMLSDIELAFLNKLSSIKTEHPSDYLVHCAALPTDENLTPTTIDNDDFEADGWEIKLK